MTPTIEELVKRIEDLEAKVKDLEDHTHEVYEYTDYGSFHFVTGIPSK